MRFRRFLASLPEDSHADHTICDMNGEPIAATSTDSR